MNPSRKIRHTIHLPDPEDGCLSNRFIRMEVSGVVQLFTFPKDKKRFDVDIVPGAVVYLSLGWNPGVLGSIVWTRIDKFVGGQKPSNKFNWIQSVTIDSAQRKVEVSSNSSKAPSSANTKTKTTRRSNLPKDSDKPSSADNKVKSEDADSPAVKPSPQEEGSKESQDTARTDTGNAS